MREILNIYYSKNDNNSRGQDGSGAPSNNREIEDSPTQIVMVSQGNEDMNQLYDDMEDVNDDDSYGVEDDTFNLDRNKLIS